MSTASGSEAAACTASVWKGISRPMARWRSRTASTIAGSGWTVPTSLFAYITETSTVSSRTAAAIAAGSTTPCSSTPTISTSKPKRSR